MVQCPIKSLRAGVRACAHAGACVRACTGVLLVKNLRSLVLRLTCHPRRVFIKTIVESRAVREQPFTHPTVPLIDRLMARRARVVVVHVGHDRLKRGACDA